MYLGIDEARPQLTKLRAEYAAIVGTDLSVRASARKEVADAAAAGSGDFSAVGISEGRFIDVAIHKDRFLTDAAIVTGLDVETPTVWKTRYAPVVGVATGSVYGSPFTTMYITQDNWATLTPFVIDSEQTLVPKMALTQDPEVLGQRQAALERQAEALGLQEETMLISVLCQQPLGTDIPTSVTNQMAISSPYANRTVYVLDPGVQSGTVETSNNINVSSENGLTFAVAEAVADQAYLSKRQPRTVHIPVAGLPWRTLMRTATLVATTYPSGTANPDLKVVPPSKWEEIWNSNFYNGVVLNWGGYNLNFKTNNVLPQGYGIITTNQPAAEVFNVKGRSLDIDIETDARNPYFVSHYSKREVAICVPDPWLRNIWFINFGSTSF